MVTLAELGELGGWQALYRRRFSYFLRIVRELPSLLNVRQLSLHVRRMARVEIDTHRQVFAGESQRVTKLLLAHLSGDGVAELLLDLLLGLPLTAELFRQLAFFILSCKPISYCRFKRIDVYIL